MLKKNDIIAVKIETFAYGGRGIGKFAGVVVFVPGTVPGDTVSVRILKKKPRYAEAQLLEVTQPSSIRIQPRCTHFGTCGGCAWQNIPYEKQLEFKEEIVGSILEHIGRQYEFTLHPIIPSRAVWRYRNKMDFTFGTNAGGNIVLGFHKPGSFNEVLDVKNCFLQPEVFDDLLQEMQAFAREKNLTAYDPKTHKGLLRHFILRCATNAHNDTPVLAILLTAEPELPGSEELLARLRRRCPLLSGFIHGQNRGKGDVAYMDAILFQWGDDFLTERLDDLHLRLWALSFFQTNTEAAKHLYHTTREYLSLTGSETLLDAYCGVGAIGLLCARDARWVYGIEIVKEAIWDARKNAARNSLDNCTFLSGELRKSLPLLLQTLPCGFQRVVVDPPRSGIDKKSLRKIVGLDCPILVYVSCNPATLARDAHVICEAGYQITDVQPVDMFPHTYHIELVTRFRKM